MSRNEEKAQNVVIELAQNFAIGGDIFFWFFLLYQVVADGVNGRADIPGLGQGQGVGGGEVDDGVVVGTIGLGNRDDNGAFFTR